LFRTDWLSSYVWNRYRNSVESNLFPIYLLRVAPNVKQNDPLSAGLATMLTDVSMALPIPRVELTLARHRWQATDDVSAVEIPTSKFHHSQNTQLVNGELSVALLARASQSV
jgi:hypothetical protein